MKFTRIFLICLAALALSLPSCRTKSDAGGKMWRMGEQVQAGPLIYNVIDAQWLTQIDGANGQRLPQNRFLVIHVSITNSGGQPIGVPGMSLETPKGESYYELESGDGIQDWLPGLRRLSPAETREGRILFDAPQAAYQLRVQEDAELEQNPDKVAKALIEIPLSLQAPIAIPTRQ